MSKQNFKQNSSALALYYTIVHYGNYNAIKQAFDSQEAINWKKYSYFLKKYQNQYITVFDKNYPKQLHDFKRPPYVLFFKGKLTLLTKQKIFGVFAAKITEYSIFHLRLLSLHFVKKHYSFILDFNNFYEQTIMSFGFLQNIILFYDNKNKNLFNKFTNSIFIKNNLIISLLPLNLEIIDKNEITAIKIILTNGIVLINTLRNSENFLLILEYLLFKREIFCLCCVDNFESHNQKLIAHGAIPLYYLDTLGVYYD